MYVSSVDPACIAQYNPKNIDDCINHWCYKIFTLVLLQMHIKCLPFFWHIAPHYSYALCVCVCVVFLMHYCSCVEKQL